MRIHSLTSLHASSVLLFPVLFFSGCYSITESHSRVSTSSDFTLSVSSADLSIPAGGEGTLTVMATRASGHHDPIQITLAGSTEDLVAEGTIPANADTLQFSIQVAASAPPQTLSTLTLVGSAGNLDYGIPIVLTITPPLSGGSN